MPSVTKECQKQRTVYSLGRTEREREREKERFEWYHEIGISAEERNAASNYLLS